MDAKTPTTIEHWPLARLRPFAANARTHSPAQVEQLAASITQWGWTIPLLIDEEGVLIAGHGRALAATLLQLATVPVIVARGWSEAQKRAYRIADNKLAENAGWDDALLRIELAHLSAAGFNVPLIGFTPEELTALSIGAAALTDPDDTPAVPAIPTTRPGDCWLLGKHRLVCGDATDAAVARRAIGTAKPNLMATDPPYGTDYDAEWRHRDGLNNSKRTGRVNNDDRADWRAAWAHFPGNIAYVWCASLHIVEVQPSLEAQGFVVRNLLIWVKPAPVISRGDYHWQHEPCLYAVRNRGNWCGDRKQTTVWPIANRNQDIETEHSTQKPVECMRRPIENNSKPGQAVYDPFVGSGTTIIAAEMSRRTCHAIEIDPGYVDVAVARWQQFTGLQATLEDDGRTFAEVPHGREAVH